MVLKSSRIVLRNVKFRDSGFYICRIEYSSESYESKIQLKIEGLFLTDSQWLSLDQTIEGMDCKRGQKLTQYP